MNTVNILEQPRRAPNLFVPIVLMGGGVILLLSNLGLLPQDSFLLLLPFWPVLMIVAGIQIIVTRMGVISTIVSALLGLAVVVGAFWYLMK